MYVICIQDVELNFTSWNHFLHFYSFQILSSATEKGAKLRAVLRETWFNLADANKVLLRFIMGFDPSSVTPSDILQEVSVQRSTEF